MKSSHWLDAVEKVYQSGHHLGDRTMTMYALDYQTIDTRVGAIELLSPVRITTSPDTILVEWLRPKVHHV